MELEKAIAERDHLNEKYLNLLEHRQDTKAWRNAATRTLDKYIEACNVVAQLNPPHWAQ